MLKTAKLIGESVGSVGAKEIEIEVMWHFLHSKKQKLDLQSSGS
jgi:hypothetical protein